MKCYLNITLQKYKLSRNLRLQSVKGMCHCVKILDFNDFLTV